MSLRKEYCKQQSFEIRPSNKELEKIKKAEHFAQLCILCRSEDAPTNSKPIANCNHSNSRLLYKFFGFLKTSVLSIE